MALIVLVAGPPAAGKSTYVAEHFRPGDVVLDFDQLAGAINPHGPRYRHEATNGYVCALWDTLQDRILGRAGRVNTAWVVRCAPTHAERDKWRMRGAVVVVLATQPDECKRRIAADPSRERRQLVAVDQWWYAYQADERDEVEVNT